MGLKSLGVVWEFLPAFGVDSILDHLDFLWFIRILLVNISPTIPMWSRHCKKAGRLRSGPGVLKG